MPEGPETRSSTVQGQKATFIQQLKARVPAAGSGTWRALPDTSEEKPQARTENYSSGHVAERVSAQQLLGGSGPDNREPS